MAQQLDAFKKQFRYYKQLADDTFKQLTNTEISWQPEGLPNSIAIIMNHIAGNQLSRFTDFLTTDGEKDWRNRDAEFAEVSLTPQALLTHWEAGWNCLFTTLNNLSEADLNEIVYIRNVGHTVFEALLRQLAHYASHIGQIMYIGKMIRGDSWTPLSIPKGNSSQFNQQKFSKSKTRGHFTDEYLK